MHLVAPLVSGIRGAENGYVHLYRRGAAGTYVTYYSTFEGADATTPTGAVALDSNGGGVFYVNEETLCVVTSSAGATVRSFVAGSAASSTEVISQSFTGTDYDSAATGVSKPVALSSALDLWTTNSGFPDWKVDVGGVATTLREAMAVVGAAFINVKSSTYGAIGNGTANDTAAVQAAIDAANGAGGGTVFFPPGTYKITSHLTVSANVSLQGAGPNASVLAFSSVFDDGLLYSAQQDFYTSLTGLKILPTANNSASIINCNYGKKLRIENCHIGSPTYTSAYSLRYDVAGSEMFVLNTTFDQAPSGGYCVHADTLFTATSCYLIGCRVQFNGAASQSPLIGIGGGMVLGTMFDFSGMTSGTLTAISASSSTSATGLLRASLIAGCTLVNPTGGTVTFIVPASNATNDGLAEFGNRLGDAIARGAGSGVGVGGTAAVSTYFGQHLLGRDRGRSYLSSDAAAVTVSPGVYALAEVNRTANAPQTITLESVGAGIGPVNQDFILVVNNLTNAAASGTVTLAGSYKLPAGATTFSVNANRFSVFFFKSVHYGTTARWVLVNSQENLA